MGNDFDLDDMELEQLRNLKRQVDRAISAYDDRRRRAALAAADEAARQHGFSLAELNVGRKTRARMSGPVTYANPDDRSQIWSGRGRRPAWFQAQLAAGRSKEDMKI